ncbi:MAG: tyrosine protein phosphatase [Nocardioidaceae bacterium]|nr:tyrosine protein phosphatase [Nocardioidaceae bacterium]
MVSERDLAVDGLFNIRDLGGLPRRGGGVTPSGVFARSEMLERVTPAGWRALHEYGVRTVVDLRRADEVAADPVAHPDWLTVLDVDVDDLADEAFWAPYLDLIGTAVYYLPHLREKPDRTGAALAAIASAPPGGVLFHCGGGRDRTGMVAMLLLLLAGVEEEQIVADYLETVRNAPALWAAFDLENPEQQIEEVCRAHGTTNEQAFRDTVRGLDLAIYLDAAGISQDEQLLRSWRGSV